MRKQVLGEKITQGLRKKQIWNLIPDLSHSTVCVLFLLHAVKSKKYKSSIRWMIQPLSPTTLESTFPQHHRKGGKEKISIYLQGKGSSTCLHKRYVGRTKINGREKEVYLGEENEGIKQAISILHHNLRLKERSFSMPYT